MLTVRTDPDNPLKLRLMFSRASCELAWEAALDDRAANGNPRIARTLLIRLIHDRFRQATAEYALLKSWPDGSYIMGAGVRGDAEECWISVHFFLQDHADQFMRQLMKLSDDACTAAGG